jgi:membrane protease YdiL (CAAX protease family)
VLSVAAKTSGWFSSIWTVLWKSALFIFLWGLLYAPFIIPFKDLLAQGENHNPLQVQLFFQVIGALAGLGAAWLMVRFIDRRPFTTLGFAPGHLVRDILLGVWIGAAWLGLSVLALWLIRCVSLRSSFPVSMSASPLVWTAAALMFNTVTQEVLVRSYIYQTIQSKTNFMWAIVGTSIFFVLLHGGAFAGAWLPALNVFLAGVFLGVAYHRTGNLWLPITIHFTWNLLLGPVFGLTVSGQNQLNSGWQLLDVHGPALLTGGPFGMEGGLIVSFTTTIGAAAMFRLIRRDTHQATPAIVLSGQSHS